MRATQWAAGMGPWPRDWLGKGWCLGNCEARAGMTSATPHPMDDIQNRSQFGPSEQTLTWMPCRTVPVCASCVTACAHLWAGSILELNLGLLAAFCKQGPVPQQPRLGAWTLVLSRLGWSCRPAPLHTKAHVCIYALVYTRPLAPTTRSLRQRPKHLLQVSRKLCQGKPCPLV